MHFTAAAYFLITHSSLAFARTVDCALIWLIFEDICPLSAVSALLLSGTAALHDTGIAVPAPCIVSFCEFSLFGRAHSGLSSSGERFIFVLHANLLHSSAL